MWLKKKKGKKSGQNPRSFFTQINSNNTVFSKGHHYITISIFSEVASNSL